MVSLEFFLDYDTGVDSVSNRNKKFTHFRVPIVSKSGSFNILKPSGLVTGLYRDYFTLCFKHLRYTRLFLLHNCLCRFL
jgi:hypothetical protein